VLKIHTKICITNFFSYSLAQLRALGKCIFLSLLGAPQEVTKKGAKAFPLGSPLLRVCSKFVYKHEIVLFSSKEN
jgi:hypothetical protein